VAYPLFDYEQMLFNELQSNKHLWIKKATGLGVTEFMPRYMAWLAVRDDTLEGSQMCIVVGPNIEKAIELIKRMKGLFLPKLGLTFDTKETVIELNGVHIQAILSHHIDAMRSLTSPRFILIDEGDFFPPGQQQDARDVSERYIAKSNPWIVMVSTPNAPEGLFERIEKEPESTCLYHRVFLDYTYGLGRIYTQEEIEAAKASPSFEREYNLKYLGIVGNVFHTKDIEAAIEKGRNLPSQINSYTQKSVGLDPGFGSSAFGVCITELVDGIVNVVYANEFERPDFGFMISKTEELLEEYNVTLEGSSRIFVDGANPSFIRALKERLDEDPEFEKQIDYLKSAYPSVYDLKFLQQSMYVIPILFAKYHKDMLAHCKEFLEYRNGLTAIHPKHDKLITALRTAVENGEGIR
ncbi:MAG: DEAD/DEAH box helicase family protein, partial [Nitrososphaeraceae archaeon]